MVGRMPDELPLLVAPDDPRADDVRSLVEQHLAFAHSQTVLEHAHALDLDGLLDPRLTLFSARRGGELLAIGALVELNEREGEIKSMHTRTGLRGQGIGRRMLDHLLGVARERGYERVNLETGTMASFEPARRLYETAGFRQCAPFAGYPPSSDNTFMTLDLTTMS
jgi:putative acetyltransferase